MAQGEIFNGIVQRFLFQSRNIDENLRQIISGCDFSCLFCEIKLLHYFLILWHVSNRDGLSYLYYWRLHMRLYDSFFAYLRIDRSNLPNSFGVYVSF